jgi:C4-dicarboxylate transporter DctQ subunit
MLKRVLDHLEEWLIAVLMGAATLLIFVAVVHRYSAGIPFGPVQDFLLRFDLSWAQELCIFMFIWMAKFGAAYGVRTGIHVGVDVLINRLPPGLHKTYVLVGMAAGALFTGVVGTLGASFTWDMAHTSNTTPDLELPKWIVYLCIPLGSYLMCFRFLQVAWYFWRTGELPKHDVAHVEGVPASQDVDAAAVPDNLHPLPASPGARP